MHFFSRMYAHFFRGLGVVLFLIFLAFDIFGFLGIPSQQEAYNERLAGAGEPSWKKV